jgi:hypothetical protein
MFNGILEGTWYFVRVVHRIQGLILQIIVTLVFVVNRENGNFVRCVGSRHRTDCRENIISSCAAIVFCAFTFSIVLNSIIVKPVLGLLVGLFVLACTSLYFVCTGYMRSFFRFLFSKGSENAGYSDSIGLTEIGAAALVYQPVNEGPSG